VAERAQAFETFYDDREWNALRASTNEGSEIVNNMDDILLRGPPPDALPADGIYEFVRGAARGHTDRDRPARAAVRRRSLRPARRGP
jgi:hypothetical protein